jgi:hypothetical protein
MLQFEKPDPKAAEKKWPVYAYSLPDTSVVDDFQN